VKVLVVFSFGYSLHTWKEAGNLKRELEYYKVFSEIHKIKFIFLTFGDNKDYELIKNYEDCIEVIPIYESKAKSNYKIYNLINSLTVPFRFKKRLKDVHIIKANQLTAFWTAVLFKFIIRKPLVTKTGYDAYLFSKFEKKPFHKQILFFLLTQLALICSNTYTSSSFEDIKFIKKRYFFSKNVVFRPNWVNEQVFKDSNRTQERILMVGRLEEQKNYEFAFKSIQKTSLKLDIIGTGKMEKKLYEMSLKSNINVEFLGNIDYVLLSKLYKEYKFFLLVSKFEGNPKVLLEAMSSGCIPIVSNIVNNLEIITDGQNGIVVDIYKEAPDLYNLLIKNSLEYDFEKIKNNALKTIKDIYSKEEAIKFENDDFKKLLN